jgi:hypothetical protein
VERADYRLGVVEAVVEVHFGSRGPGVGVVGARLLAAQREDGRGVPATVGFGDGAQLGRRLRKAKFMGNRAGV